MGELLGSWSQAARLAARWPRPMLMLPILHLLQASGTRCSRLLLGGESPGYFPFQFSCQNHSNLLSWNYLNYSFHFSDECSGKPSSSCIPFTQHRFHLTVQKRLLELFSGAFKNMDKTIFLSVAQGIKVPTQLPFTQVNGDLRKHLWLLLDCLRSVGNQSGK